MDGPDWEVMWDLFHQARALPADERKAFLDRACSERPDLRREVEELLEADEEDPSLLDDRQPVVEATSPVRADRADALIGARIGPYVVREELGRGGMGVVYGAVQETPVQREVALKVLRLGMDSDEVVARFESERQALALMSHSGIARVFDAGLTEDGRPYFAMERVRGVPITDYCDRHQLTVRDRLKLFIGACKAVHHAHQKAIIHRDLKPSNILVTVQDGEPVAKVIDFGVAKALDRRLTGRTLYTELGRLIGTPEYMSPEQAEMTGLDIDTRTDIYSLGVLLYEMLAGALPFDPKALREAGYAGVPRFLREVATPRPSTRFTALGEAESIARLRRSDSASHFRRLRGDLDWVVLKAMEKDRTRRYESASELAADLARHLEHRPVEAGPPGVRYRLGKFVRRHRVGVAAAAAVLVALLLGLAGVSYGWIETRRAQRAADIEREKAERTSAFLAEMLASAAPEIAQGQDTTLLEQLLADAASRVSSELDDQPLVAASVHHTLGETYRALALYTEAETHLSRAVALYRAGHQGDHRETLTAQADYALYLWNVGRYEESARLNTDTLEARRRLLGLEDPATVTSMNNLALVLFAQGKLDEVESMRRQILEIRRRDPGVEDRSTVIAMSNLGVLLRDRGQLGEAESLLREAVEIQRRVFGMNDPDTLISLDILGEILTASGNLAEAESLHVESLEGVTRVLGPKHPNTLGVLYHLGRLQTKQGKHAEAEGHLRTALAGVLETVGEVHRFGVLTQAALAECLHLQGKLAASRALYDRALELAPQVLPPGHRLRAGLRARRAAVLIDQGLADQGEAELLAAIEPLEAAVGLDHEETRRALERLIDLYRSSGRDAEVGPFEAKLTEGAEL